MPAVLGKRSDVLDLRVRAVLVEVGVADDLAVDDDGEEAGLDLAADDVLAGEQLGHDLGPAPRVAFVDP